MTAFLDRVKAEGAEHLVRQSNCSLAAFSGMRVPLHLTFEPHKSVTVRKAALEKEVS